ncbi:MAG: UPF0280 family protein [Bacillota bacterium]|nr:UPF0280 family protein [Bacillota bacterium]
MYEKRTYREYFKGSKLTFFDVVVFETDLRIGAEKDLSSLAYKWVVEYRNQLEEYIKKDSLFLTSLVPTDPKGSYPYIIQKMCEAAKKAGVGPMAAVAGALSELVGLKLLEYSDEVIVENGGDLFVKADCVRKVGIYAGTSPLSGKLALEIQPGRTPVGICTSSGTVGHSLSFGKADAAVIISEDTFLADAVATATGNVVKDVSHIEKGIEFASGIEGVVGAVIIVGDKMGIWGDVKLTKWD